MEASEFKYVNSNNIQHGVNLLKLGGFKFYSVSNDLNGCDFHCFLTIKRLNYDLTHNQNFINF